MTPEAAARAATRAAVKAWTETTRNRQTRKQETMTTYQPTETDKLTGERLRDLRKRRGETMVETITRSGIGIKQSAYSRTELGQRRLTEIEAAKLAAHFGVAVSQILKPYGDPTPITEQVWLGNDEKPTLFAVPDTARSGDVVGPTPNTMLIDLREPLTPEQYRLQVWLPYLEARYAADHQKTA